MYQDHSVERKILPFTEWSPDIQQFETIAHSLFFCERMNCCQRGERRWFASWCKKGTEPLIHTTGTEISPSPSQQKWDQQKLSNKPLFLSSIKTVSDSTLPFYNISSSSFLPQGCHALIFISATFHPYNHGEGHVIYPPLMYLQKCPPKPRDKERGRR